MQKCEKCGNLNPLASQFCDECGTRLNRQTAVSQNAADETFGEQRGESARQPSENAENDLSGETRQEISTPNFTDFDPDKTIASSVKSSDYFVHKFEDLSNTENTADDSDSHTWNLDEDEPAEISYLNADNFLGGDTAEYRAEQMALNAWNSNNAKADDEDFLSVPEDVSAGAENFANFAAQNEQSSEEKPAITSFEEHGNITSFDAYASRSASAPTDVDNVPNEQNSADSASVNSENNVAAPLNESFNARQTVAFGGMTGLPETRNQEENDLFRAKLVIERGESAGKEFIISGEETNIGRWDADGGIFPDIDLDTHDPEAKVSRRHARIVWQSGQFSVEDLGSTNGTFINRGRRLLPGDKQPLKNGDEIIVGKTFLRFHVG